ncbi:MAG: hypothetical protein M1163_03490 [Candidatus Thermoplasmatota archaeon]|nr:hypothetical protein [Candidatus Thermoplasmatota archaeon]
MIGEQEHLEDRCDVVARVRGLCSEGKEYKRILKIFKIEGDFIVLELTRDATTEGSCFLASMEATADKPASYGAEYFDEYADALACFGDIAEKYGLEDSTGNDFGSD